MNKRTLLAFSLIFSPLAAAQSAPANPAGLSNSIFKLMNQVGTPAPAPATGGKAATPAPTPIKTPAKAVNWAFKPSVQQRTTLVDKFVDTIAETDPNTAAEWRKMFDSADIFAEIEKGMTKQFGTPMSVNNVVDVWATYWGYAWLMSRSRTDDPTPKQMAGLRSQFKTLLSSLPGVEAYTEAQKQELSDGFTLQILLYGVLAEAYKDDPQSLKEFGDSLIATSRDQGFDLSKLNLTDQGFVVLK